MLQKERLAELRKELTLWEEVVGGKRKEAEIAEELFTHIDEQQALIDRLTKAIEGVVDIVKHTDCYCAPSLEYVCDEHKILNIANDVLAETMKEG